MNVRLENIHTDVSQSYVSFLNKPRRSGGDRDSIHSVSSVRSVMSGMGALWSTMGLGSKESPSKSEKAKAALEADLKYLYSAFTKIPSLRLAPDHHARLIRGYEEFPFDTAVPLYAFKNMSVLEIVDIDYRSFFGWDRVSEQLRSLTVKRANLSDPADLLTGIVLDDMDKRRRRSSKSQPSPVLGGGGNAVPQSVPKHELAGSLSAPGSPVADTPFVSGTSPHAAAMIRGASEGTNNRRRTGSISPSRPISSMHSSCHQSRGLNPRMKRTGSGSSNSSEASGVHRNSSSLNLLAGFLPPSKWRFLRHLCLADNSLTSLTSPSLAPVANTLQSLDLSANLFTETPDSLASLVALRSLNLSDCMIDSLHSLSRNPLPAISALNLRGNRLHSLAGIERLPSLERLDLRGNKLTDPTEIARLAGLPEIREIWVSGNPFVKSHSGYRVTIFNLFRRTPGYSEDIIIDGSGPGYTERKQLVDRAAEPESAPVVRSALADRSELVSKPSNAAARVDSATKSSEESEGRHGQGVQPSGFDVGSARRKKVNRRRIVDVSVEKSSTGAESDLAPALSVQQIELPLDPFVSRPSDGQRTLDSGSQTGPWDTQAPGKLGNLSSSSSVQITGTTMVPPTVQGIDWNVEPELCRQKLEALRQEVGSGWLTVLGDHAWDGTQKAVNIHEAGKSLDHATRASLSRNSSQAILSGTRTLG